MISLNPIKRNSLILKYINPHNMAPLLNGAFDLYCFP